jgi:ribosome-binding protein aMBF1 (putative translation factor)
LKSAQEIADNARAIVDNVRAIADNARAIADNARAIQTRTDKLRAFESDIRRADIKANADFQRIIQGARSLLELPDQEIAMALFVSRPTVNRWINGRNLPYLVVRKHAVEWIRQQLSVKIKHLKRTSSSDQRSERYRDNKVTAG